MGDEFELAMQKGATPIKRWAGDRDHPLVNELRLALLNYDIAFEDVLTEASQHGEKMTESKMTVSVRNKMRERGHEHPEIVRVKIALVTSGAVKHE
jgi:hypothetical protein